MTTDPPTRKYGSKSGASKRSPSGRFGPGNPGKPRGARHKTTIAIEGLMGDHSEQVTTRVIKSACEGDMTAAKLVLDRIAPARKGRPVSFKLPDVGDLGCGVGYYK